MREERGRREGGSEWREGVEGVREEGERSEWREGVEGERRE